MSVLLLRLVKVVGADGEPAWVEVSADVAEILEATEPPLKERLLKDPASLEKVADRRTRSPWEGPRFGFALLLGSSPTWSGPGSLWLWHEWTEKGERGEPIMRGAWTCRFCRHYRDGAMPESACCLNCARTGRDRAIPLPTKADLARRTRQIEEAEDGLKGGTERVDAKAGGKGKGKVDGKLRGGLTGKV